MLGTAKHGGKTSIDVNYVVHRHFLCCFLALVTKVSYDMGKTQYPTIRIE